MPGRGDLFQKPAIALRHSIEGLRPELHSARATRPELADRSHCRGQAEGQPGLEIHPSSDRLKSSGGLSRTSPRGRPLLLQLPSLPRTAFMIKAQRAFDMQWNLLWMRASATLSERDPHDPRSISFKQRKYFHIFSLRDCEVIYT
jgi:hypothetical protein